MFAAPADDRRVIGGSLDVLARYPVHFGFAVRLCGVRQMAAIVGVIGHVEALKFPRIAGLEPCLGKLLLPALRDLLFEQAMLVADAIALRRDRKARHAFHKACRKATETTIAECSIRFDRL